MIGMIMLSPLLEQHIYGISFIRGLFTIMMTAAVYAAGGRQSLRIVALGLAIPWLLLSLLDDVAIWRVPTLVTSGLVVALNIFVGCIILQKVTAAREVDLNILSGAIGLYLLIAINWAVSFAIIEALVPGSFATDQASIPWHEFLYFSLTTISTLGYGDILPTTPFARIWATMEAVTGLLYLAILVARLVSLYKS